MFPLVLKTVLKRMIVPPDCNPYAKIPVVEVDFFTGGWGGRKAFRLSRWEFRVYRV